MRGCSVDLWMDRLRPPRRGDLAHETEALARDLVHGMIQDFRSRSVPAHVVAGHVRMLCRANGYHHTHYGRCLIQALEHYMRPTPVGR